MTTVTFSPILPTLAGSVLPGASAAAFTPVGATGDLVPISNTGMTLVILQNSGATTPTVKFQSQPDNWGNTGTGIDYTVTVPTTTAAPNGVLVGVLQKGRFGNPGTLVTTSTGAVEQTCMLTYSATTNLSICVIHVPWASQ